MLLTIKAEIYLYVPSDLTVSKDAFCIYGFRMIFTVKSQYFLKQH
jgi:predicted membrane protein